MASFVCWEFSIRREARVSGTTYKMERGHPARLSAKREQILQQNQMSLMRTLCEEDAHTPASSHLLRQNRHRVFHLFIGVEEMR